MGRMSETGKDDPFVAAIFLRRYLDDQSESTPRSVSFYQRLYPGYEELIAREYAALDGDPEPTEDPEPSSSRRIGRFRIEREIGRGGQGVVYEATDTRLQRRPNNTNCIGSRNIERPQCLYLHALAT